MTARMRVGVACGFGIGAGVAVQARINGALGARLHDGIAAATVSFGTGLVLLMIAFAVSRRLRGGLGDVWAAVGEGRLRVWQLLGGLCGAFFVASQGLTVAAIGVTAFTVAVVAGQLVSSLVVDRLGIAPSGRTPVTPLRAGAAVIAIGAVFLASSGRSGASPAGLALPESVRAAPHILLIVLPALAGIGLAWQQAVNGRVGEVGGPAPATLINFAVGFAALVAVESVVLLTVGGLGELPGEPWLYLGGAIGVAFIGLGAVTVRWIGVLLLGLTSVAGQLVASVLLDLLVPGGPGVSVRAIVGCALTLLALLLATRPPGRSGAELPDRPGGEHR
ncbi:DMT family transporter [Nocardia higoensis]|uniref:DMT family transporter n=1 Tax=Nocardia higoensis TaxID=228599 RepID=UPI001FE0FE7B|nr:DMT family transporter [Nocardia higoensis]